MTVAIPVKNGADFLGDAINSGLAQTWPDLEVLVVDDGSDDGGATAAVAWSFGERIRLLQQENKGVSGALNTALSAMTGDIFTWLSHDDLFEPDKTALQAEAWMRAGSRTDVALFADFRWIDEHGNLTGEERAPHDLLRASPAMAVYDGRINGCTVFAPRHLLLAEGGFDETHRYVQDYRMWRRLVRRGAMLHMPTPVARIRRHAGQDSNRPEARHESERFWSETLASVTEVEAAVAAGSLERFLVKAGDFLRHRSPNKRAAEEAFARAAVCASEALVSVVLDVGEDASGAAGSLRSALAQTHPRLEIVAVGSEAVLRSGALDAFREHPDILFLPSDRRTATGRLAQGCALARGAWIALMQSPAVFEPGKVATQMRAMSAAGAALSHSSYRTPDGVQRTGAFTGRVYPEIVGRCPVALSTVMLHRVLAASGLVFLDADAAAELSWIEIAARMEVLGLDEAWTALPQAPPSPGPELLAVLEGHPLHGGHGPELARLRRSLQVESLELEP